MAIYMCVRLILRAFRVECQDPERALSPQAAFIHTSLLPIDAAICAGLDVRPTGKRAVQPSAALVQGTAHVAPAQIWGSNTRPSVGVARSGRTPIDAPAKHEKQRREVTARPSPTRENTR